MLKLNAKVASNSWDSNVRQSDYIKHWLKLAKVWLKIHAATMWYIIIFLDLGYKY